MVKMKHGNPLFFLFIGISLIASSLSTHIILLGSIDIFSIIISFFERKEYDNDNILILIATVILVISLTLTYLQLSSPLYSGDRLGNYILAILCTLSIIIGTYDITQDYKLSKISKMENVGQKMKNIIAIFLLILGILVGLLIGIYIL